MCPYIHGLSQLFVSGKATVVGVVWVGSRKCRKDSILLVLIEISVEMAREQFLIFFSM